MHRLATTLAGRRWFRRLIFVFAALAVAIGGVAFALRLAGPLERETDFGRISFEIAPSLEGGAEAYVPLADWGFRADAFDGPIRVRAELRTIDRQAVLDAVEGGGTVLEDTETQISAAVRASAIRSAGWALGGVLVCSITVAAAIPALRRRRWRFPALSLVLALALGGSSGAVAILSFDTGSFTTPTYYANGGELAELLELAEQERLRSPYGDAFASLLRSSGAFLTDSAAGEEQRSRDIFLGSDLHANPLVVEPISRFVGDEPLFLAGDFSQHGNDLETELLAPRIAALGERVIATSGNHDSAELMAALAAEGVTVLGEAGVLSGSEYLAPSLIDVDGLSVAAHRDPLEWESDDPDSPARVFSFDDVEDGETRADEAFSEIATWFGALGPAPDVVMLHQNGLASRLADSLWRAGYEEPLVILTGHDHRQRVERYGSITLVDAGTLGADGAFGVGSEFAGLAELHFDPELPLLRAVDLIGVEPVSGRARASRVVIGAMCPEIDRCAVRPEADTLTQ